MEGGGGMAVAVAADDTGEKVFIFKFSLISPYCIAAFVPVL